MGASYRYEKCESQKMNINGVCSGNDPVQRYLKTGPAKVK